MRIAKKIKKSVFLVAFSTIILTALTFKVAYSAVFEVKSLATVQQITSGTLNVVINNTSQGMSTTELFPISESELPTSESTLINNEWDYATLVLNNSGKLDSVFSVTLSYDTDTNSYPSGKTVDDLISFDYLVIGIYDVDNGKWVPFGSAYHTQVSNIQTTETNVYPILRSNIAAQSGENPTVKQYKIYIWLKEDTPASEIGKLAYLKINVKSTTINDGVNS